MLTRTPFASAMPIAALLFASLTTGEASAGPHPPEPPQKPKPAQTAAPTPPATAAPTAAPAAAPTAAPAAAPTAAPAASAAAKPSATAAVPAASGATAGALPAAVKVTAPGLAVGSHDSRLAALAKLIEERKGTIDARRKAEQDQTRVRWGALVEQPAVMAELKTHAERVARLGRIQELAEVEGKPAVAQRAGRAFATENARHEKQMQSLAGGAK